MSLASRSMQVSLTQRIWQAQTADRRLASDLEVENDASHRSMRVLKKLAPSEYLLPIRRIAEYGREEHEKLTLPGFQKGQQLLATKLFDAYAMRQGDIKDSFNEAVKKFVGIYPEIVAEAPKRLGNAYRESDFPTTSSIGGYFSYDIRFFPVPDSGNWLVEDVDMEDMNRLRNEIENEKNAVFRDATQTLIDRTVDVLTKLDTQTKQYPDEGKSFGLLRDATVSAVKEIAMLIPFMNITNDPVLAEAAKEIKDRFKSITAEDLRSSKPERKAISDLTTRILAKLNGASAP